jgi:hypothetical protein
MTVVALPESTRLTGEKSGTTPSGGGASRPQAARKRRRAVVRAKRDGFMIDSDRCGRRASRT